LADLVAIISSFCARVYGQRQAKRTTETIVKELTCQGSMVAEETEVVEDATG
jgi:hypothetical protein